jgi:hypothetical protein
MSYLNGATVRITGWPHRSDRKRTLNYGALLLPPAAKRGSNHVQAMAVLVQG